MSAVPGNRTVSTQPAPTDALRQTRVRTRSLQASRVQRGLRRQVMRLLDGSGVTLGGHQPWDLQVHDPRFFARTLAFGSLGFGDAYVDGWWDADDLAGCLERLLRHSADARTATISRWILAARHRFANVQLGAGSWVVGRRHYDLGDDLFECMLGARLVYSCAYWADATDLDAAQVAKLDLVCRKLELSPGMRVLDVGCGWGEALKYAAQRYGVSGVGVTVSGHQAEAARRLCAGLPIEIRLADYRTVDERFDRVFSLGMFEHVGPRNHATFFEVVARCLERDGLALLHTIGTQTGRRAPDPWIERHIFPNSAIPRLDDVVAALRPHFIVEDLHNFGLDYVRTLEAWRERFDAAWPRLEPRYGSRFRRVWHYYLAVSIASFRARRTHLWQFVLAPDGRNRVYRSSR
ncbi:MAG TPA: cyclopropane fatty acyl phospholipid synthase [Steroidobacteraceae bacterium]|nr:cyclopropane fatty acyl phospholipid synthase [Steroidobacteraceae bacterium]